MRGFKSAVTGLILALVVTSPALTLDFPTLVPSLATVADVHQAELGLSQARLEASLAGRAADLRLTAGPTMKMNGTEDGTYLQTDFDATLGVVVATGLTDAEKERLFIAQNAVRQAELSLVTARTAAYIQLHRLYQDLWLLQEEGRVLGLERNAAALTAEAALQRYEAGTQNLALLWTAEEELRQAEEDIAKNALSQKLAWYALNRYIGTDTHTDTPDELTSFTMPQTALPTPAEAQVRLLSEHPSTLAIAMGLEQRRRSLELLGKPDLDISVRPFGTWGDNTASLGYTLSSRQLSATYTGTMATLGSLPTSPGSSLQTWNAGVGLVLSWTAPARDKSEAAALRVEIQRESAKLADQEADLGLELRIAYQRWKTAAEAVAQATRALERVDRTLALVESRRALGQALGLDVQTAQAEQARASWRLQAARIESEKAWLSYANDALLPVGSSREP